MPSPEIKAAFRKVWCCFLVLRLLWPAPAWAATASQVFEKVKDSVVVVKAYDRQGKPVEDFKSLFPLCFQIWSDSILKEN